MIGPVFADANVIVCRFDTADPRKQSRAVDWFTLLGNRRSGRVSFQVLPEACAVLTRKRKPAIASGRRTAGARRGCWACSPGGARSRGKPRASVAGTTPSARYTGRLG